MIEGTLRCVPISSVWFVFAHKLSALKQAVYDVQTQPKYVYFLCTCCPLLNLYC